MEPDTVLGDSSLIPVPEPLTIKVTPCTETQGPPEAYRNQSNPRGALLVANYSSFDSPDSKPRLGSEVDAEHITELFRQIGYENAKSIIDATKQDTEKALLQFRDEKIHADVDSLVVVFMSHGADEYMCTTDGEIIHDQEVIEYFNDINCPTLKGKPKYFIFQHCRGKKERIVIANKVTDSKVIRKSSVPQKRIRRELSDVYVCYSTLPGFVSYRYDFYGSPYIDRICRVFMEEAHRKEIDALMKQVEKTMPEAQATEIRRLGFKSDFYFNPCSPRESASSVTCSDAVQTEESIYETTSSPRGHVLIINNLEGCQQDIRKLHDIFSILGFNVLPPRENLTKEEMEEAFSTFSQTPQYDSSVVIFYGKGFEDCIMSNDGKITTFQKLVQTFNDVNCPNLSGKPKLFFMNTVFTDDIQQDEVEATRMECATELSYQRDIVGQAGLSTDGNTDLDLAHSTMPVPAERDMYLLSVEVDGECKHGSLLTEALYQVLITYDNSKELMALTKLILRTLDNLQQGNGIEEKYHHEVRTYRFQRDYYFNPPKFNPSTVTSTKPRELKIPKACFPKKITVKQVKQPKNTHSDYRNWSRPHGLALIISFDKYDCEDLPNCPWRQNVANILAELYCGLGYRTEICNNPTIAEAKARLEEFSNREEHLNLDSLFVTILGLARDWDSFYCADGKPLHLSDVYSYFTEHYCPALKGKPKLFFLHMTEMEERKNPCKHLWRELKDTFVVRLASKVSGTGDHPVAGLLAWRKALEEHSHDTHLESLISKAEKYLHDLPGASSNTVSDEHFAREVYAAPGKLFFNPSKV